MIATQQLSFQYPGGETFSFPDIASKEHLLIQGNSGSGKTTLLHLLAGLLIQKSGSIKILHQPFSRLNRKEKEQFRNRFFGIAPQAPVFVASLNMGDYLELIASQVNRTDPFFIHEVLKELQIEHLQNKKPNELSGGEQQRFGLVAALLHQPKILFADEPTAALDKINAQRVVDMLLDQASDSFQLVVVSHDQRIAHRFHQTVHL